MAHYNKVGLLVLNESEDKFLTCQKSADDVTAQYIMPGGQVGDEAGHESESILEALEREIEEELGCKIKRGTISFIGEFIDVAAGRPDRDVSIKLYKGELEGTPKACAEIRHLHWIGRQDKDNEKVSPIIRNKIIPGLIVKNILK